MLMILKELLAQSMKMHLMAQKGLVVQEALVDQEVEEVVEEDEGVGVEEEMEVAVEVGEEVAEAVEEGVVEEEEEGVEVDVIWIFSKLGKMKVSVLTQKQKAWFNNIVT